MINLSKGMAAIQSSFSEFSRNDDPLGAIQDGPTGYFTFHTQIENDPWWLLDLGSICRIEKILVFNRGDAAQDRIRFFSVEIFNPAVGGWKSTYSAENEFGGAADDSPLVLNFGRSGKLARYIKLSIKGKNCLHLDHVKVLGHREQEHYQRKIAEALPVPNQSPSQSAPTDVDIGAIVGLVRGYDDLKSYGSLIERNEAIYQNINSKRADHYPLIIWHEGNILAEQQEYILSKEKNNDVKFIDISDRFKLPDGIEIEELKEGWSTGYRLMCKFNCTDIWDLSEGYKYILRIDEDCILSDIVDNPFEWMESEDLDCAFSWLIDDSHDLTNETLPSFVEAYRVLNSIHYEGTLPLTSCFPYTNVMMGRVDFFRSKEVEQFLRSAVATRDFYVNRWGDHVVLGVPLHLFSKPQKIKPVDNLKYHHYSHEIVVASDDEYRNGAVQRSATGRNIDLGGLSSADREAALLHLYMNWPIDALVRSQLTDALRTEGKTELAARLDSLGS